MINKIRWTNHDNFSMTMNRNKNLGLWNSLLPAFVMFSGH